MPQKTFAAMVERACAWDGQGAAQYERRTRLHSSVPAPSPFKMMVAKPPILPFRDIEKDLVLLGDPTGSSRKNEIAARTPAIGNTVVFYRYETTGEGGMKEEFVLWDDLAPSDEEDDDDREHNSSSSSATEYLPFPQNGSQRNLLISTYIVMILL